MPILAMFVIMNFKIYFKIRFAKICRKQFQKSTQKSCFVGNTAEDFEFYFTRIVITP